MHSSLSLAIVASCFANVLTVMEKMLRIWVAEPVLTACDVTLSLLLYAFLARP